MPAEEQEMISPPDINNGVPELDVLYSAMPGQNFAPPAAAIGDDSEARSLLRKAWEKINQGEPVKAAEIFEMALFEGRRVFASGQLGLADFVTDIGSGLFLCGSDNHSRAVSLLRDAIEIRSAVTGEANLECGRLYRQLSSMLTVEEKYTEAVSAMRKTIDIFETMKTLGAYQGEEEIARLYKSLAQVLNLEDAAAQVEPDERAGMCGCVDSDEANVAEKKEHKLNQTDYAGNELNLNLNCVQDLKQNEELQNEDLKKREDS